MNAKFKFIDGAITYLDTGSSAGAKTMVKKYLSHPNALQIQTGTNDDGEPIKSTLKGLKVPMDDLQALIDKNYDHALILFAVSSDDVGKPAKEQDFTTILAGVEKDGTDLKIDINSFRNTFSPCPTLCSNYDDVFPHP